MTQRARSVLPAVTFCHLPALSIRYTDTPCTFLREHLYLFRLRTRATPHLTFLTFRFCTTPCVLPHRAATRGTRVCGDGRILRFTTTRAPPLLICGTFPGKGSRAVYRMDARPLRRTTRCRWFNSSLLPLALALLALLPPLISGPYAVAFLRFAPDTTTFHCFAAVCSP